MQRVESVAGGKGQFVGLDIGGTFIKSGFWTKGAMMELPPVPVNSQSGGDDIISSFAQTLSNALAQGPVAGVGICIPDPFDYPRGISLMKHKFASLYGLDLAAELRRRVPALAEIPIRFSHDAVAFLAGELGHGAAKGFKRAIGITLGTGIGVAGAFDGVVQLDKWGSTSQEISLWDKPYLDGIVEDRISTKALVSRYRAKRPAFDVARGMKGIAEEEAKGDAAALAIFLELGADLNAVLTPVVEKFDLDGIVLGGQVSKSFNLFEPVLSKGFNPKVEIRLSALGGKATLIGAIEPFLV